MKINGEVKEFLNSLRVQSRVVHALMMREIITRFGRKNLGFLWLFLEPMLFTMGVVLMWNTFHATRNIKFPIAEFAFTGYITVLCWRNMGNRLVKAIEPNLALMYHQNVKLIDIFFARAFLELIGVTGAFVFISCIFLFTSVFTPVYDIFYIVIGWLLLCWFALGLGLFIGSLTEISDVIERLWHPISYFMLPISGAFFLVQWLPESFRQYAVYIPMVNCVELIRYGFLGNAFVPYYNIPYIVGFNLILMFAGMMFLIYVGRRIELEY